MLKKSSPLKHKEGDASAHYIDGEFVGEEKYHENEAESKSINTTVVNVGDEKIEIV